MARPTVDELLAERAHPLGPTIAALRTTIRSVDSRITEEWKWNAPSFSFRGYLVTFNLRDDDRVLLVFHDGAILDDQDGFLTGTYPDRRLVSIRGLDDAAERQAHLRRAIEEWIAIKDRPDDDQTP